MRTITFVSYRAALYFADLTRAYHGWTAVVSATDTPAGPRWLVVLDTGAGGCRRGGGVAFCKKTPPAPLPRRRSGV